MNESVTHVDTPQSICRFGIAHGDITPPPGIYCRMWGAARHDRATGVHRPLRATVMVFREAGAAASPDTEQILVCLDHCTMWSKDMSTLLDRVVRSTQVPKESVVVSFSHTHAAGLMDSERESLPGGELIPGYLQELAQRVAELVTTARNQLQNATITYGIGHCDLAAHRDFWDDSRRQHVCGYNPAGPADDTVVVARVAGVEGETLATVVNYACHPTTLAWDNTLVSPDYPGAMREVIETATGAPCVFIQGASGDLGPKEGFTGEVSLADRNGRQLGYAALSIIESLPPPRTRFAYTGHVVSGATIGTWAHVAVPPAKRDAFSTWRLRRWTLDLDYRAGLPTCDAIRADRNRWQEEESNALAVNDREGAQNARAFVERKTRELSRRSQLPPGSALPYRITLWRMGDALWLAVEGEPYNLLQRRLRERFSNLPIVVEALAYGSRVSYLPPADVYGKDIYQESIAVLAPGSLERLVEEVGQAIEAML